MPHLLLKDFCGGEFHCPFVTTQKKRGGRWAQEYPENQLGASSTRAEPHNTLLGFETMALADLWTHLASDCRLLSRDCSNYNFTTKIKAHKTKSSHPDLLILNEHFFFFSITVLKKSRGAAWARSERSGFWLIYSFRFDRTTFGSSDLNVSATLQ